VLGAAQAEMVSAVIEKRDLPWNVAFGGAAVCVGRRNPPPIELDGGLTLTLLSPTRDELKRLRPQWKKEVEKAGIAPGATEEALKLLEKRDEAAADLLGEEGPPDPDRDITTPFVSDDSVANGSSIVLLAQYDEGKKRKSVLLCGDAYPSLVERGLGMIGGGGRVTVDALKLSHHGSKKNTDVDLIRSLTCDRYLVSTNSAIFQHPNNAALARVVKHGGKNVTLCFNYRTKHTLPWDDAALRKRYGYTTNFPPPNDTGLTVSL
jgi:hypothetical protein